MDEITTYSVYVNETNLANFSRSIRLSLASGGTAFIGFPAVRPNDWLQFDGPIETIDDHIAEQLLPVLREALSNIACHAHANKVRVAVTIFGRATPVELDFAQVEKV